MYYCRGPNEEQAGTVPTYNASIIVCYSHQPPTRCANQSTPSGAYDLSRRRLRRRDRAIYLKVLHTYTEGNYAWSDGKYGHVGEVRVVNLSPYKSAAHHSYFCRQRRYDPLSIRRDAAGRRMRAPYFPQNGVKSAQPHHAKNQRYRAPYRSVPH